MDQHKVNSILRQVVVDQQRRLTHGAELREVMHEQLRGGVEPAGYRFPWITQSALELVNELQRIAKTFNEQHPDDKASLSDLLDIVKTAEAYLESNEEEEGA
jgi:hypothetical protein